MTRKPDRHRDQRLRRLWLRLTPLTQIAQLLGYSDYTNVSHAARRLGLPRRVGSRHSAGFYRQGERKRWYRCEDCGGRSESPLGHRHGGVKP